MKKLNYMVTFFIFTILGSQDSRSGFSNFIRRSDGSCEGDCEEKCCVQKCGIFLLLLAVLNSGEVVLME